MSKDNASRFGIIDLLMLLTSLIWAVNFSVLKIALREFSPHAFNGPRLTLASLLLLAFLWRKEGSLRVEPKDLAVLAGLGIVGNTVYQTLFINGLDRTTASSTSLVMTITPIFIALMSAIFIRERIHWAGWLGILISFGGLYLVLFGGAPEIAFSNQALKGNVMILTGNFCWAVYTVFSKPYLEKYSPLKLTALTLAAGTLFYLPISAGDVLRQPWESLSAQAWAALLCSAVFAIALSYFIWYSSVRRIGNTKTGIFGNITPAFTVFFAHLLIGERVTVPEVAGAVIVILGFYLTRFGYRWFETRKPGLL